MEIPKIILAILFLLNSCIWFFLFQIGKLIGLYEGKKKMEEELNKLKTMLLELKKGCR